MHIYMSQSDNKTAPLVGGFLCYLDFLVLLSKFPLKRYFSVDTVDVYYVFLFWLLVIMIWWIFGFGRIFSGAIDTEPFMGNFDLILSPLYYPHISLLLD